MRKAGENEVWQAKVSTSIDPKNVINVDNPENLSSAINTQTNTLCSSGNTFSMDSIVVNLISPDAPDLTVVDLPGIIRTVTSGQRVNVIEQVNNLIKSFLVDKRTIILAVIPGNQVISIFYMNTAAADDDLLL
jgi:interferon-induced GTP-binding protein Mx1